MKTLYLTYDLNGVKHKATLNEERYNALKNNPEVSNIILYPTEMLMEQNYSAQNGNPSSKRILFG